MADDLPPGFTLDPTPGGDLPPGFTLDEPKSGGAFAAKELAPGQAEQGERRRKLMQLLEAKGEPGYMDRLTDNFSMGLTRPISGAASVAGGAVKDALGKGDDLTTGERWRAGVGAEEDYMKRAEKNTNPYLGAAVDFVGGLASGGPVKSVVKGAATVAQQAPTKAQQIYKAILGSAGSGAIEGAARNSESVENAVTGAGVGGAIGGVAGGTLGALTSRLGSVQAAKKELGEASREGGSKALKEEGGALYKKLDEAGISFKDTPTLTRETIDKAAKKGFNPEIHKELTPVLEQIGGLSKKPATWTELQNIRTQISDAKGSDDKRVRKMAGHLGDVLDNFVETAKPTLPQRSIGINVGADAKEAKALWRKGSQAENVEWLSKKGMASAKDPSRKLETNFSSEVDKVNNPKRFSTHQNNPEQVALLEQIAGGDKGRTAVADTGRKWSNNLLGYGTIGSAGGLAALSTLNDPYGLAGGASTAGALAMGAGLLGKSGAGVLRKQVADRGAERVNTLIRNIVTGSSDKPAVQNLPREALAKVLAAEQLKRGAGRYSASFFDKE